MYQYQQLRFFGDDAPGFFSAVPDAYWLALAGAIGVVAAAGLAKRLVEKRRARNRDWSAPFTIKSQSGMDKLLDEALRQRSKLNVNFTEGIMRKRPLHSALLGINEASLVLEASAATIGQAAVEHLAGRNVSVFFKLDVKSRGKQFSHFYSFDSSIAKASLTPAGLIVYEVKLPEVLFLSQRRAHLRMDPPHRSVQGLSLWRAVYDREHNYDPDPSGWGPPSAKLGEGLALQDISGGGLRLALTPAKARDPRLPVNAGARYFVLLDLASPESEGGSLRLRLATEVRNSFSDSVSGVVTLGLQAVAQASLDLDDDKKLRWEPTSADGVNRLADWVLKRHLELYREKGVA